MATEPRALRFRGVAKSYGGVPALRPVALDVAPGEFLTLLGPSGSGKTTLLNIAAGFIAPDAGSVHIGDADVTALPPRRREVGMVFQSYALFPHLSVFENVAYGLRVRGVGAAELGRRVASALALVRLEDYGRRRIQHLSGGQQQRVALARALVVEPAVLLMDEPMGALDRQLRKEVQLEIRRLHRAFGRTTLHVTHDQEEALALSDRIGIMRNGRIEQLGSARELYRRPANVFVASFLGESNILRGRVASCAAGSAHLDAEGLAAGIGGDAAEGLAVGREAGAIVRPEAIAFAGPGQDGTPARVAEVVYLGEIVAFRLVLRSGQELWRRSFPGPDDPQEGGEVRVIWRAEDVRIVPFTSQPEKEA